MQSLKSTITNCRLPWSFYINYNSYENSQNIMWFDISIVYKGVGIWGNGGLYNIDYNKWVVESFVS